MNLKKKFVIGAASLALVAGMGVAPAMAVEINLPGGLKVDTDKQRVAGDTRVETSLAAAKAAYGEHPELARTVYLVGYNGLIDAATAGMLDNSAATRGAVVALPQDLKDQKLFALAVKKAFPNVNKFVAIGGTATVSDESLKAVAEAADVAKTDRLGGANRYETNIAIATAVDPSPGRVYLTRGDNPIDALTAGTLEGGMVVLVPQTGDVPQKTINYVSAGTPEIVVVGGQNSLSDEQASKVVPTTAAIETTPWNDAMILDGLRTKVQTYAALYFGQKVYQDPASNAIFPAAGASSAGVLNMTQAEAALPYDKIDPAAVDHDGNPATAAVAGHYWGLNAGAALALAARGAGADNVMNTADDVPGVVETEDAADISVKTPVVANATAGAPDVKIFGGYANIAAKAKAAKAKLEESTTTNADGIEARVHGLQTAVQTSLDVAGGEAFADFQGNGTHQGAAVIAALKKLYGTAALTANPIELSTDRLKIVDGGFFKFTSNVVADAKFAGLNTEKINEQVAADKKDTAKKWATTGQAEGTDLTIKDIAKRDATDFGLLLTATNSDANNTKTNWIAIKQLVDERFGDFGKRATDSKEMLINAVRDYHRAANKNGSSTSAKDGTVRIAGNNRYETSALLSVFQSKNIGGPTLGEGRMDDMKFQYLASGNDANLADSVFAGQLKQGTILLVPTEGNLDALVKAELVRKGSPKFQPGGEGIFASQVFTVGGKAAISDTVFVAAVNAMAGK